MKVSKDEAAIMLAALACSSDGQFDQAEEVLLRERLRPQLQRLGKTGEERALEHMYRLVGSRGMPATLVAIREALPAKGDRLAAVRLAAELVRSDGLITREEMEHLAEVGHELDLDEAELRDALSK